MKRKDFLQRIGVTGLGMAVMPTAHLAAHSKSKKGLNQAPPVCTLVPSETLGPFPSLPSGDSMYWRSNLIDGQAGVQLTFTIKINGTVNCGVLQGYRVDVWHCNVHGFYSHYAASGANSGHGSAYAPANNANLIYGRGSQVTNAQGEVTFTTIFPGWYPGRTCHIHFAVYSGGVVGSSSGWTQVGVSQFTFPITAKNALYTSIAPYTTWGADPLHPDNDNVFNSPAGSWSSYQLATLVSTGSGTYTSYYEAALTATGVVLPLELIGFNGSASGQNALLWWKTAQEKNFSHFEIEWSEDGEDFEFVSRVDSKGNGTDAATYYQFTDQDRLLRGNAYYRLKMVDLDGTEHYSASIAIKADDALYLKIYPSPVSDFATVQHSPTSGDAVFMIMNVHGQVQYEAPVSHQEDTSRIDMTELQAGIYFLILADAHRSQSLRFIRSGN